MQNEFENLREGSRTLERIPGDQDMIDDLSHWLDALWWYYKYIANADRNQITDE